MTKPHRYQDRWRGAASLILLISSLSRSELARADASTTALAEALFRAARDAMSKQRYAEACDQFSESQRLEPKLGTLLNLAVCHERQDRSAAAWAEFSQALSQARALGKRQHEALAEQHLGALSSKLALVSIVWQSPALGQGLELDGIAMRTGALGIYLPLDPGEHLLKVTAPEHETLEHHFVLGASDRLELRIPALRPNEPPPHDKSVEVSARARLPAATPPSLTPSLARAAQPSTNRLTPASPAQSGSARLVLSIAALAVGAVGVGVGVYGGLEASAKKRRADDGECWSRYCTDKGLSLYDEAKTHADLSKAGFVIGAVGIASGALLLLTAPSKSRPDSPPSVGVLIQGLGASLKGSF